ncbi:myb-like protein V [Chenopodium quinoa]|uniref:myb-like protein V n=1 Tax=Chenopodium quinoa TaxID=63459 RepID=UPI000B794A5F|nr:myb-like protein V [Chenopodium quinoa]
MIEHLVFYAAKTTIPCGSLLTVLFKSFGIDVESESPTYIKPENILSEQSLLRLSLKLESGIITFLTRGGEEKNSGKGKTQVVEGDTSESEEEESESKKEESKEKGEEDKEGEEISEGETQEAEPEKEEETQSEGESSSESESLDLPFKGELRRSKRKIVKPTVSTLKPVIIEDISSSDHSDPDFTPTQVPFASEPSSVHDSPPKQAKPSSTPVSPPKQTSTSPSPSFPTSQPTGFAAFSGTNASIFDIQQVKTVLEQLTKIVSTKLEEMAKQLTSLQRQVQAVADTQATSFTGMENKVDAAAKNILHSTQEILETINRVAFEEVEEASNDPINPADEPTYSP